MTTRDELTVLPPAESPDPKALRILHQCLHPGWDDPTDHPVVFFLQVPAPPGPPKLVGPDGEEHVLPAEVFEVLREVVSAMVEGKAVTVAPIHQQLTTQEVADFLRVRRPALIELLDAGEIPYEHVGRHRRVRLIDALEYRHARSERRREVLDELVSVSEAAGMYETTATPQATR